MGVLISVVFSWLMAGKTKRVEKLSVSGRRIIDNLEFLLNKLGQQFGIPESFFRQTQILGSLIVNYLLDLFLLFRTQFGVIPFVTFVLNSLYSLPSEVSLPDIQSGWIDLKDLRHLSSCPTFKKRYQRSGSFPLTGIFSLMQEFS